MGACAHLLAWADCGSPAPHKEDPPLEQEALHDVLEHPNFREVVRRMGGLSPPPPSLSTE